MNRTEFLQSIKRFYTENISIVEKKNADYAVSDNPFANFERSTVVGVSLERGILVRLMDKIARITNLLEKNPDVVDESIKDTISDAANYLAILNAYMESKDDGIYTSSTTK